MYPAQAAAFAALFQPPPPHQPPYSADNHLTPAANPNLNLSQPLPSHPSYSEMITAAIQWENSQGKEGGSSKRAIEKYIDRVYTELPPTHSALLSHHLKRLKNSGQLVMIKNSYQLPSFAPSPPPPRSHVTLGSAPDVIDHYPTPKRKPGRPPKNKQPEIESPVSVPGSGLVAENGGSFRKRGRGRPPKQAVVPFVQPISEPDIEPGPGQGVGNGKMVGSGKRRGRPPRNKQEVVVQAQPVFRDEEGVVKRAGRPAKANVGTGRGRGRPKRVEEPVVGEKKRWWPRGRPRGKRIVGMSARNVLAAAGGGVMKRRGRKPGRKPKGSGELVEKVYNGKPRGRPKRNSALANYSSGQGQETVNEELLKMLEDMQSKLRDAVGVIRPHLADQSAPDALTALQQLEELSTMNVTASQPPAPPVLPMDAMALPQTTSAPESLVTSAASLIAPTCQAFTASPGMNMPPLPYSMDVTEPLHAPYNIENQQPMSWDLSSDGQS